MRGSWSDSPDQTPLLIAAASGRALAAAANRAGYRTAVLDLFNDTDLQAVAEASQRVARAPAGGFDEDSLVSAAARLAPSDSVLWGFVYGAGFEARPSMIDRIAAGRRLFGNTGTAVRRAKDPAALAAILDRLGVPYPAISLHAPAGDDGGRWLVKQVGGSGGIHVRFADEKSAHPAGKIYFQRFVPGRTISAQVIGAAGEAICFGLSEQWAEGGAPAMPFRFGGAAAPATIPPGLGAELREAACTVTRALDLVGLCSVDFLVDEDARCFHAIEVNPRPGATLEIFEHLFGVSLLELHLRACAGAPVEIAPAIPGQSSKSRASVILYAEEPFVVPATLVWPPHAADLPQAGTRIAANEPICTVFAESGAGSGAESGVELGKGLAASTVRGGGPAEAARTLALARAEALRGDVRRCMQSDRPLKGASAGDNRPRRGRTGPP